MRTWWRRLGGTDRLTGTRDFLAQRSRNVLVDRLRRPMTCIPRWRAEWWGMKGVDERGGRVALRVRRILPRAERTSPFSERLSRSRYLHLGFHASISETQEQREAGRKEREWESERERERERERAGSPGVLTLYVAFCPSLIILSLPSYSYLGVYPARQRHEPFGGEALIMRVQSTRERHEDRFGDRESVSPCRGDPSMCRYVCTHISPSWT